MAYLSSEIPSISFSISTTTSDSLNNEIPSCVRCLWQCFVITVYKSRSVEYSAYRTWQYRYGSLWLVNRVSTICTHRHHCNCLFMELHFWHVNRSPNHNAVNSACWNVMLSSFCNPISTNQLTSLLTECWTANQNLTEWHINTNGISNKQEGNSRFDMHNYQKKANQTV